MLISSPVFKFRKDFQNFGIFGRRCSFSFAHFNFICNALLQSNLKLKIVRKTVPEFRFFATHDEIFLRLRLIVSEVLFVPSIFFHGTILLADVMILAKSGP